ncbi:hypothetical protein RQP54_01220 [Curvibacter sp. APW13]|uniref:hypothetical protein n=1 Tax=Curvibacter sp. APW13 TaxID=3077236 RepID=UPI0028E05062|nr:hypothetical protein [Curvibacter sp. APW13]MDT8989476.1 hypothetical protein [Curvibacter sp. APW13]
MSLQDWEVSRVLIGTAIAIGFFVCAALYFYYTFFYKESPDPEALLASQSEASEAFWKEARKRRRIALLMFPCWLIAGPFLVWVYSAVFFAVDPLIPMIASLATYMVFLIWLGSRFTSMRCFHCGEKAFDNLLVFKLRCQHCGVSFKRTEKSNT